ncbi:MAG TPA: DUF6519 domain-containing protein [Thermoanaerobaculia bacterium]|nr:DUF6519 domain-containing protein [Thermoanaerobaculia bacterium]
MSGDYSRFTDRPLRRYSGVLMQQGRVQLDADWNEHVDIAQRRWELQAKDTFGRSAVPRVTTPDGFKIGPATIDGKPDLEIGAGRVYVDGKLAELFPDEKVGDKAVPVSYLHQPFYPEPPALPTKQGYVVFLDVWDREVTWIEDPDILEKALGGPDTATRRQTVWQVKWDGRTAAGGRAAGEIRCGAPPPAPSGGRLSTQAVAPPPSDDPCTPSPSGGYRGLENRLYRVEVHLPGLLGAARFKWSRDNASVVSAVTQLTTNATASELVVSRIGRDAVLRFAQGNWVEITDDVRELMGEPGEMAKIAKEPDEATRTITLDRKIPAAGRAFGANAQELADRHTKIRRWDQTLGVDANGLLSQTPDTWISLEDGVQVQLFQNGADLKTGDYWLFAARTVDGSVEPLNKAEPRGIRHHYCQLAAIPAAGEAHDCRHLWPETCGCCCTAEVGDGASSHGDFDDLPQALAQLSAEVPQEVPLVICLLPGTHHLKHTVAIRRDRVTIRGCGRASHVVAPPNLPAFDLEARAGAMEGLYITCEAGSTAPAIVCSGRGNRVEGNEVVAAAGPAIWSAFAFDLIVTRNRLSQEVPTAPPTAPPDAASPPADRQDLSALLVLDRGTRFARVAGNFFGPGTGHGIGLTLTTAWEVAIADNEIRDLGGSGIASIRPPQNVPAGTSIGTVFDEKAIAAALVNDPVGLESAGGGPARRALFTVPIPLRADHLRIERNTIAGCARGTGRSAGPPLGGIVLSRLSHVQISENRIEGNGQRQGAEPVAGIYLDDCQGLLVRDNVVVDNGPEPDGNQIPGFQGGILAKKLSVVLESSAARPNRPSFVHPDGWPAAAIQDNLVVAPRGPALVLEGMGPMPVTGNQLTARDVLGSVPGAPSQLGDFFGAVLIVNFGMPAYLFPQVAARGPLTPKVDPPTAAGAGQGDIFTVGGKVEFSDNQVNLDLVSGNQVAIAAVGILTLDDLSLEDNQTECNLLVDILLVDMLALAMTVRANGNGCTESPAGVRFSLWSIGLLMSTGVANQGTHCIKIDGPAGRLAQANNLELLPCPQRVRGVSFESAQSINQ